MIVSKKGQFVFIANTKTGSTSIEAIIEPYATMSYLHTPELKHMGITKFNEIIRPEIDEELISYSVVREPIDWLFSWYRYRSRDYLNGDIRSTASMSFETFVDAYLTKPREEFAKVGSPTGLMRLKGKDVIIDHVYAFEHIEDLVLDLGDRVGLKLILNQKLNISPNRDFELSPNKHRELVDFFARDYEVYYEALKRPRRITAA